MKTITVEKRRRGPFGWIVAIAFWGFQVLMVAWLWSGVSTVVQDRAAHATDAAYQAGSAIGIGIGVTFIGLVWLIGTAILGVMMLLTRGKKITTTTQVAG